MKYFLVILLIVQLACVDGWRRRRRRRTPALPPVPKRPYIDPNEATWTNWHSTFSKQCPSYDFISRVRSIHSNRHEDRTWAFYCKTDYRIGRSCSYSGWRNSFGQPLIYQCPYGVLTGVHSKYSSQHKDRAYDFECCRTPGYAHTGCYWTSYKNNWDGNMDYSVPYNRFLVGAYSHHNDQTEDRKWKFFVCRLTKYAK